MDQIKKEGKKTKKKLSAQCEGTAEPHHCALQTFIHSVHGNKSLGDLCQGIEEGQPLQRVSPSRPRWRCWFPILCVIQLTDSPDERGESRSKVRRCVSACPPPPPPHVVPLTLQTDSCLRWWPLSGEIEYLKLARCCAGPAAISSQPFFQPLTSQCSAKRIRHICSPDTCKHMQTFSSSSYASHFLLMSHMRSSNIIPLCYIENLLNHYHYNVWLVS